MTLCLLAAGGAMFMTAMNVSTAWGDNLKRIYIQRLYDLEVRLNGDMLADSLLAAVASVPGVKTVEKWNSSSTSIAGNSSIEVTQTYPDKGHGSFVLMAGPVPTKLLNPTVVEGRWLHNAAANDVVLNQMARKDYNIGDQVVLNVDGKPITWNIIGFSEDVGSPATAYVSAEALASLTDSPVGVNLIRISYHDRARENASLKNRDVELFFENAGISVGSLVPVWLLHNAIAAHMKVLVNSLMAMAILMALVGSIGLMSTMSMNVLERTREIGVMRAIGATPQKIKKLIVWEGLLIGGLSIFAAFGLSLILSMFMGRFIGNLAFRTPLSLTISPLALAAWVLIIIIGSYLATLFPSRRANRITTREALAYE
jgi:putative ABC transport system permease protein